MGQRLVSWAQVVLKNLRASKAAKFDGETTEVAAPKAAVPEKPKQIVSDTYSVSSGGRPVGAARWGVTTEPIKTVRATSDSEIPEEAAVALIRDAKAKSGPVKSDDTQLPVGDVELDSIPESEADPSVDTADAAGVSMLGSSVANKQAAAGIVKKLPAVKEETALKAIEVFGSRDAMTFCTALVTTGRVNEKLLTAAGSIKGKTPFRVCTDWLPRCGGLSGTTGGTLACRIRPCYLRKRSEK